MPFLLIISLIKRGTSAKAQNQNPMDYPQPGKIKLWVFCGKPIKQLIGEGSDKWSLQLYNLELTPENKITPWQETPGIQTAT